MKILLFVKRNWNLYFLISIVILFILIVQIYTNHLVFKLDSDYDAHLPLYDYIFKTIKEKHYFPQEIPLIGEKFPVIGDPLSAVFNPLVFISFLFADTNTGMRIIIYCSIMLSALSMFIILKTIKISSIFRVWGALTYAFSGALVSRIAIGHVERIVSYPLLPIIFRFSVKESWSIINAVIFGLCLSLVFLSGDSYSLYLMAILILPIRFYFFIRNPKAQLSQINKYLITLIMFILPLIYKVAHYLIEVKPNMLRYFVIEPLLGSINPVQSLLLYLIPTNIRINNLLIQDLFGKFEYNWFEYNVFIGAIPLLLMFLAIIKDGKKNIPYILMLIIGLFYVGLKFTWSPFYWLNKINPLFDNFRVPTRMLFVMTPILIFLSCDGANRIMKNANTFVRKLIIIIMFVGLIYSFSSFSSIYVSTFEKPREENKQLIKTLKSKDKTFFDVALFRCCYQLLLIENDIRVINYYYGWRMKNGHPNYLTYDAKYFDINQLWTYRPKYLVTGRDLQFNKYDYTLFLENASTYIWINNKYLKEN